MRIVGTCLNLALHLLAATIGTVIALNPLKAIFHPANLLTLVVEEYLLSASMAFILGAFFYYQRPSPVAKWVGFIGLFGVLEYSLKGPGWFSVDHLTEQLRLGWHLIAIVSVRTVGYGLGAWFCEIYLNYKKFLENVAALPPQPESAPENQQPLGLS